MQRLFSRLVLLLLLLAAAALASVTVSRTSDDLPQPSTIELEVALPDSSYKLKLSFSRTDAFENIPITVVESGLSRTFLSHQVRNASHSHYTDVASSSVISVRHVNGKRRISGHVVHEGRMYFLEPLGDSAHRVIRSADRPRDEISKLIEKAQVDVRSRRKLIEKAQVDVRSRRKLIEKAQVDVRSRRKLIKKAQVDVRSRWKRQTISSPTKYVVELFLLLDDSVWSAMQSNYRSEETTMSELLFYYTHILTGIDTVYRNMRSLSISVKCVGMRVSKTPSDSTWMANSQVGSEILPAMIHYSTGLPADHFMAFTRKEISVSGIDVSGASYPSGICKDPRASVIQDSGPHSWSSAAHELAHNLGAEHDSEGNNCSESSKFILAQTASFYSVEDVWNSYRFSPCTEAYIYKHVTSLGPANCLLTSEGEPLTDLALPGRLGTRWTLDQVCRLTLPNSQGVHLTPGLNPASICASITCLTASGKPEPLPESRAPVGSLCGNRKSCNWNGECSPDTSAPTADENCFWGDFATKTVCEAAKLRILQGKTKCTREMKQSCCNTLKGLNLCAVV